MIPVASHQNQGRIIEVPLEICLPLRYPTDPPTVWVRPNLIIPEQRALMGNLIVRQTGNVDGTGMVRGLESLSNLRLVELLVQLQNIFKYQLPIISSVQEIIRQEEYRKDTQQEYRQESFICSDNQVKVKMNKNYSKLDSSKPKDILKRKVMEELEKRFKFNEQELEKELKIIETLEEGGSILNRERMTLNNEINLLNKEINILESKRSEMESIISTQRDNSLRSATVPSDPISSQLLELLSNEAALMDVLYSVIKVTITPSGGEKINLTMALRCIREMSRKQFLTKCHIRKITTQLK